MTFSKNSSATLSNSGSGPAMLLCQAMSDRNWRENHSSHVSHQSLIRGTTPLKVWTWNPNFPVGEADDLWSFSRTFVSWTGSGTLSLSSRKGVKKNDLDPSSSKVPWARGIATLSGRCSASAFWLSYSPLAISAWFGRWITCESKLRRDKKRCRKWRINLEEVFLLFVTDLHIHLVAG